MEDNFSLVTGAKKEKTIPNYDKNNFNLCISNFSRIVLEIAPEKIKESLINLSIKSDIEENYIRPTAWKIFLNVLPSSPDSTLKTWIETVKTQRAKFKTKVKELKTLKKYAGDPLGNAKDPEWNSFFVDSEIKKIITLDVNRTYQDKDLFCSLYIKEILNNILFIWAKEHKYPSYRQGMNEILAVLIYAIYPFYKPNPNKKKHAANNDVLFSYLSEPKKYQTELYEFFHDETEMQSDLYYLFTNLMDLGVTRFFEIIDAEHKGPPGKENETYLLKRCREIIDVKLKDYDSRLFNHFKSIELDVSIVLQRYLKCLFNREFHPKDVEVLWDLILADEKKDNKKGLIMVDYISVGLFAFIKNDLLRKDQNECFQRLFKYPPIESAKTVAQLCLKVQNDLQELEIRRKIAQMKPQNIEPGVSLLEKQASKSNSNSGKTISEFLAGGQKSTQNNSSSTTEGQTTNKSNSSNALKTQSISTVNHNSTSQTQINGEAKRRELIRQLEDVFNKYRMSMELRDIGKITSILEQLKNNSF